MSLVGKDGYNRSVSKFCSLGKFQVIDEAKNDGIRTDFSPWGNDCIEITEEDIDALRQGKMLRYDDSEYVHFIVMKVTK